MALGRGKLLPLGTQAQSREFPIGIPILFLAGIMNHFASACMKKSSGNSVSKTVNVCNVTNAENANEWELFTISETADNIEETWVSVKINGHPIKMMIDCGAAVSCISESQAEQIGLSWSKSETQLSAYGGTKLEVCGKIQTSITRILEKPLLGRSWFPLLGIQIHSERT